MDPDTTLARIRECIRDLSAAGEQLADNAEFGHVDERDWLASIDFTAHSLVEYIEALTGWLDKGGYPPEEWQHDNA